MASGKNGKVGKINERRGGKALSQAIADFKIDGEELSDLIDQAAFRSGDYPYEKKMNSDEYERELLALQIELLKVQGTGSGRRASASSSSSRGRRCRRKGRSHPAPSRNIDNPARRRTK